MKTTRFVVACLLVATAPREPYSPARYRDGPVPALPVFTQIAGGGEVLLELAVTADGRVADVTTLRTTPPFTGMLTAAVRLWRFEPAEETVAKERGSTTETTRVRVPSKVLVAGVFHPPTLLAPTVGEPPMDVAAPSIETPYPLSIVAPGYPPLARVGGSALVEARLDSRGGVVDVKPVLTAPPFDRVGSDAARQWVFRPARAGRTPVPTFVYILFGFPTPTT